MELSAILDRLCEVFGEGDVRRLAASLDLVYDFVPGDSTRDKLRELLGYAARQDQMTMLTSAMLDLEPDLAPLLVDLTGAKDDSYSWLEAVSTDAGDPVGSALTMKWVEAQAALSEPAPNPYTPGVPVEDPAMFFGRSTELAALQQRLEDGANLAVVAPGRLGVSSLLRALARQLAEQEGMDVPAYIDLASDRIDSRAILVQTMWAQWWMQIRPDAAVPVVDSLTVLATLIEKMAAARYRLVLLLDEFEQIAWRVPVFGTELFDTLERLVRQGLLRLVTGSQESPADLMLRANLKSELYRELKHFDLGLLDKTAAHELLTVPMAGAIHPVETRAVDQLLALAGAHPFYLQLAGRLLYDTVAQPDYAPADVSIRFRVAAEPFWAELWDSLSPLARAALLPESKRAELIPAGRVMRQLSVRGVVVPADEGYRPFSEGFAIWLESQAAARTIQPSVPEQISEQPPDE